VRRVRFSLAGLMGLILLLGIGLASLKNPTDLWASILFSLVVALLLAAVLGIFGGRSRLAWAGCSLFGWFYLFYAFCPWPVLNGEGLRPPRLPTAILDDLIRERRPDWGEEPHISVWTFRQSEAEGRDSLSIGPASGSSRARVMLTWSSSKQTLHSFGALAFAGIGAVAGHILAGPRPRSDA
jgi:hypothetical protein